MVSGVMLESLKYSEHHYQQLSHILLGLPGKYTPAILTVTANGSVGSIRVNNINSGRHPAVVDPANVLKYYWEVESTGITGLSGQFDALL
ncbi:MAG: hypothetical protein MZV63_10185 [Marinilabiliales bacterium]|nr:hypothetical protein [Marinilabiliales bacterium]